MPSSSWYKNVRSVATAQVWNHLRHTVYRDAGNKCQVCGGRGDRHPVECHEQWDYMCDVSRNDSLPFRTGHRFVQRLTKLVALCPMCHMAKHIGYARTQGKEEDVRHHLMKINGWSEFETELYLVSMWETWRVRSRVESWDLDLTVLTEYGVSPDGTKVIKAGGRKSLPKKEPSTGVFVLPPLK